MMRTERHAREARLHRRLAGVLASLGLHGLAVRACRDALRADPSHAGAHLLLGEGLARLGSWRDAAVAFGEAARLSPGAESQGNLVWALGMARRWPDALRACERLADLAPGDPEIHVLRGLMLRRLARPHAAIQAFRWAVQLPAPPQARRFFLGETLFGRAVWSGAMAALAAARQAAPLTLRATGLNAAPPRLPPARAARMRPRPGARSAALARIGRRAAYGMVVLRDAARWEMGRALVSVARGLRFAPPQALRALRAAHRLRPLGAGLKPRASVATAG
jgi:tetratricopeptide (TPR) repeat protein